MMEVFKAQLHGTCLSKRLNTTYRLHAAFFCSVWIPKEKEVEALLANM